MNESNLFLTEKDILSRGTTVDEIAKDLSVPNPEYENFIRFGRGRFYKKIDKTLCYLKQEGSKYIIPRYYFGEPDELTHEGRKLKDVRFKKSLRDYQNTFIVENRDLYYEHTGILLEAACGTGKTVVSLYLALMRGRQTLVIVPTYYLATQWQERIKEFTYCTSVVITSADKEIPVDRDFTIVVMDTFSVRVLPEKLIGNVGCVLLDEAHRMGASTYIPILDELPAKYRLALTATFRRSDGVHKILKFHFGEHTKMESRFPPAKIYTFVTSVPIRGVVNRKYVTDRVEAYLDIVGCSAYHTQNFSEFKVPKGYNEGLLKLWETGRINKTHYMEVRRALSKAEKLQYTTAESFLSEHSRRRKLYIRLIRDCLKKGRTVLFLSKRKAVLKSFYKIFREYDPMLIISETNSRSEEDQKYLQDECPLILGVTQLAKEGLDIDRMDTLVLDLPIKDTEQAIGRILRLYEGKKPPLVFYPLDDCPLSYGIFNNAKKFMKINGEYMGNVYPSGAKSYKYVL